MKRDKLKGSAMVLVMRLRVGHKGTEGEGTIHTELSAFMAEGFYGLAGSACKNGKLGKATSEEMEVRKGGSVRSTGDMGRG